MYFAILLIEVLTLFFLSRNLTKEISLFLHGVLRHRRTTVYLLAALFMPGTIFHELSHYFMAKLLLVPTGKIYLMPEIIGSEIRMGKAEVGKTDPLRRFFIGVAPFIIGNIFLFGIVYLTINYASMLNKIILIIFIYMIFQIGNTMFSSRKDMEGAIRLIIIISVGMILAYLSGARVDIEYFLKLPDVVNLLYQVNLYLFVPIVFDAILIMILKIINR